MSEKVFQLKFLFQGYFWPIDLMGLLKKFLEKTRYMYKTALPYTITLLKGPYFLEEGAFLKSYGPYSTGSLPELALYIWSNI